MTVSYQEPVYVTITENAIQRVQNLVVDPAKYLRVSITGGGCSGFRYVFSLEEIAQDDDTVINNCVVIDYMSLQYLAGSTLDYIENLAGANFVISNPMATGTCGCGESFTV